MYISLKRKCSCDWSNKDISHSPLIAAQSLLFLVFFVSLSNQWRQKPNLSQSHLKCWFLPISFFPPVFFIYHLLFLGRKTAQCVSVDELRCYSAAVDGSVSCCLSFFSSCLSLPFCCHSFHFLHLFMLLIFGALQEVFVTLCESVCVCIIVCKCVCIGCIQCFCNDDVCVMLKLLFELWSRRTSLT